MADATKYSKLGYIAVIKETTAGTAIKPTTYCELLSEDMLVDWAFTAANTIAGNRSMNLRPIKNKVSPVSGSVTFLVEPTTIGHWLTGFFGAATDTTLQASTSFQHDFTPQTTLKSYTIDVQAAGDAWVTRYFGARISELSFSIQDNKLQCAAGLMAQKAFTNARVTVAIGSGTTLTVDQTSGLTTADTIKVYSNTAPSTLLATLTISAVVSETVLTVSTIGASIAVDDIVVIASSTPTYSLSNELIWSGGAQAYFGTGTNPVDNTTASTNTETFELTLTNDLEARWAATGNDVIDRFPSNILVKGITAGGKFSHFHLNAEQLDQLRQQETIGVRFDFLGSVITANSAAAASGTIESDGAGTVTVTADATGEAGNDWNITVVQGTGALSAALSGKNITVTLDAVAGNNTVALVATAVAALTGVGATSSGSGNVTTTDNPNKFNLSGGRDASEVQKLRFDFPDARFLPFNSPLTEDDIVNEEIEFTGYRQSADRTEVKVRLRNATSAY